MTSQPTAHNPHLLPPIPHKSSSVPPTNEHAAYFLRVAIEVHRFQCPSQRNGKRLRGGSEQSEERYRLRCHLV